MKILLTAINSKYTHSNLALYYLRNSINPDRYNIKIINFSINQNILEIIQNIYSEKPDVICFSVYIWNSDIISKLVTELKKVLSAIKVILGGPEVSYNTDKWLTRFPDIDHIIAGPGEAAFTLLSNNNFNHKDKIIKIKNPHFAKITFPYIEKDFTALKNRFTYYESSRGCPFKCSYCLSSRSDQQLEYRELDQVKKELDFLIKQQPGTIKFIDRTFNSSKKRARDIWKFLIPYKTDTIFHFEIHPALLGKDDFDILKTVPSGRFRFEIGIQSTNPETLQAINRQFIWQDIDSNLKALCGLTNIHIHMDIICGLPLQEIIHIKKSFNYVLELQPDNFQMGFLKILPGTELEKTKNSYGIINQEYPPYQVLKTDTLSFKEMIALNKLEHLIDNIYNSGFFHVTLKTLIKIQTNAWEFFNKLLQYALETDFDITSKNPAKTGKLLYNYMQALSRKNLLFCIDALRMDWCSQGKEYPAYLVNPFIKKIQNQGRNLLLSIIEAKAIQLGRQKLSRLTFFTPESMEYQNFFEPEIDFIISGPREITDYFSNYEKEYKFIIK